MYHNTLVIVEKAFLYSSLIYLLHTAGLGRLRSTIVTAAMLACIELAQLLFAHHSPAVTDPILAMLLGAGMMALECSPKAVTQPAHQA